MFRHSQLPFDENDKSQKIRNVIKRLEHELEVERENDTKKMVMLKAEIEDLKRKLGEIE